MGSQLNTPLCNLLRVMGVYPYPNAEGGDKSGRMKTDTPHYYAVTNNKPGSRSVASPKDKFYVATELLAYLSCKATVDSILKDITNDRYDYRSLQIIHQIYTYGMTGVMEHDPVVWNTLLDSGEVLRPDPSLQRKLRTTVTTLLDTVGSLPVGDFAQRWLQREDGLDYALSIVCNSVNQ